MPFPSISILGCGWLGLPLAESFIQKGYSVKGSTTREERFGLLGEAGIAPYLIKAEQGIWYGECIQEFLSSEILIIAIPPNAKKNSNSTHAIEIKALLDALQGNTDIHTIIYISSTSVYKDANKIVTEDDVTNVAEAGNTILADTEEYIKQSIIPNKIILRLGGLTGYNRMLAKFFAGKKNLAGGNQPVNLLHCDDAIAAVIFIIEKNIQNETLNVCSPLHPQRKDFYQGLCKRFELELPDFSEELMESWKEVSVKKLQEEGYVFKFPDPDAYTYTI
jgi:nucleoside-diphosphate-sugar epimerase